MNCPSCQRTIDSQDSRCPHCGKLTSVRKVRGKSKKFKKYTQAQVNVFTCCSFIFWSGIIAIILFYFYFRPIV